MNVAKKAVAATAAAIALGTGGALGYAATNSGSSVTTHNVGATVTNAPSPSESSGTPSPTATTTPSPATPQPTLAPKVASPASTQATTAPAPAPTTVWTPPPPKAGDACGLNQNGTKDASGHPLYCWYSDGIFHTTPDPGPSQIMTTQP